MTTLFLDKEKLINNIDITKKLAGSSKVVAVIKGNAYGHGLLGFASLLVESGIETLAVVELEDAILLREEGFECEIINLSPVYSEGDIKASLKNNIVLSITTAECGNRTEKVATDIGIQAKAHICVDTGLGRHGFLAGNIDEIANLITSMEHVKVTGIYSHFSTAAYKKDTNTDKQFKLFTKLCDTLTERGINVGCRHIAATSAFLRYPDTKLDAVRVGSALLGRVPLANQWGYQPTGQLEAPIEDVNVIPAGENIGYGYAYTTKKETKIAIVPIGYSHGLGIQQINDCTKFSQVPRFVYKLLKSAKSPRVFYAHYEGKTYPVLGFIGLTSLMIDITGSDIEVGDVVSFPINPIFVDSGIKRRYE